MAAHKLFTRNRKAASRRHCTFESLEPRLALAVDLAFAGAFQVLGGSTNAMYSGPLDNLYGGGMVTDGAGNRYVTVQGIADHVVDLDPGPGVHSVTMDAALVKLDPNGGLLWSASLDAIGNAPVRINHGVDADQNVYMVGDFRGTVDFDPGPGVTNLTSTQGGSMYSFYFAKLNSSGQLQWVRKIDGDGIQPYQVAVDSNGNIVVEATVTLPASAPPIDVDPGPGQTLVSAADGSVFLKYNTNGDFVWARQLGGAFGRVTVDNHGDVYVAGRFSGSVDLDPGAGVHIVTHNDDGTFGSFIVRLDPNGNFVAAYATEGAGSAGLKDLEVTADGSIVASGNINGTVDFAPGSDSLLLTSTGNYTNGLAIKLNSDFTIAWARSFGGSGETTHPEIDADAQGNVYVGGSFGRLGPAGVGYDFDPGPGVYELFRPGTQETAYVLSLTSAGDFRWAVPLGGNSGRSQVQGMSVTADGNVQLSGAFKGIADFDPDPADVYSLNSGTTQGVFVATLTQAEPDPGAPTVEAGANQSVLVTGTANLDGTVTDDGLPGPLITTWSLQSGPGTVSFENASAVDTTATFSTIGTYLLKLEATDGQFTTADYVQIVVNPVTANLTATADTYLDGGNTTTNYGASASLVVDGKPDDGALLKWDLSSIPAGSTLQSATMSINVTGTTTDTYEIYEVKRTWTESQATWKKANSSTNWQSAGAQGSLDRGTTVLGTVTASATGIKSVVLNAAGLAVVQGWVNNPATNFGFILQDYANTTADDLVFSSKEAAVAANRPQLQVVYSPPAAAAFSQSATPVAASATTTGGASAAPLVQASPGRNGSSASTLTQPGSLTLAANNSSTSSLSLLANSTAKGTAPAHTNYSPAKRAAVLDEAFAEISLRHWPKILAEILPAIC